MKFNLIQIASIVAIIQALVIGLYFINSYKKTSLKNLIFAVLVSTYSILIICSLVLSSGVNRNFFLLAHILNQSAFLIGPLVYFYIKMQLTPNFNFERKHLIHLTPFIAATAYLAIKFYFVHFPITCRSNHILLGSLAFGHTFVYFFVSHRQLNKNGLVTTGLFSSINKNTLAWLPLLIYGCSFIWLSKLLFFIVWDISGFYRGCNEIINLHFLVIFLFFNTFLYFLLNFPKIFTPVEKYKNSILSHNAKHEYTSKLITYMENDRVYRNSLLSLKSLAKQLSIGERYLSQIINESFNENFYDFVNRYRIEESKEIIRAINGNPKTIISIAYDVGFNSKSTFNSAFKKNTGYTPKEYRKQFKEIGVYHSMLNTI
jgi:AraC-like DNA-binding protein